MEWDGWIVVMLAPSSKDGHFGARGEVAAKCHLHCNTGEGKKCRGRGKGEEEEEDKNRGKENRR